MSDSLRDRIARVIYGDLIRQQDDLWMHGHGDLKAQVDGLVDLVAVADAVIEALELAREGPNQAWIDAGFPIRTRYVTEWQAAEDVSPSPGRAASPPRSE
jgi:hypothetical protein